MRTNIKAIEKSGVYQGYPNDWIVAELGDLLKRIKKPVQVEPDRLYREIGIRSHGKGLFYKEPVKGSDLGNKSVFWIEEDCLIFNIVFAWEQAVAMTTAQEKGMIASHRFPMWQSKGEVDLKYLHKLFLTPLGKHLLELASPGGAGRNKTLGQDEFNRIAVCIPRSLDEQRRIVELLSVWDKAIDLNNQLVDQKLKQKKWLMQNLLTGKKRLTGFSGEWERLHFGDLFSFEGGLSVSRENLQMDEGICYLHYGDIHKSRKNYIDAKEEASDLPKLLINYNKLNKNWLLNDGDIVFVDASEDYEGTGKYVVIKNRENIPFIAGLHTIIARPRKDLIDNEFKRFCFCSELVQRQFSTLANGTSVYGINKNSIRKISFLCPPRPEQAAIASVLSAMDREIALSEEYLDTLNKQKNALMQLLLTGIMRVNVQEVS